MASGDDLSGGDFSGDSGGTAETKPDAAPRILVETCEITSGRARGLMKKEYHWTFAEAAALAKDLDIPREKWADYFWPEEVL